MAIFLKYGDLKGEVTSVSHKDWIECHSFQWGVGRGISAGVGGGSKREATAPSVSEIMLTKTMDIADPLLLKEAIGGKGITAFVEMTQTDDSGKHIPYQKYKLEDAMISGYSITTGGDRPSVSFSINFDKFDSEYVAIDSKFNAVSKGHVIYTISAAKSG
ncbi:Hcp family type VI secretion system effector [Muricoccus radiodurans]|uniref:Hcp family type VI secretion system effector n=1 Tax=Muricoccus radiodurans TaxID=2231721 RepID=UPI003CF12E85